MNLFLKNIIGTLLFVLLPVSISFSQMSITCESIFKSYQSGDTTTDLTLVGAEIFKNLNELSISELEGLHTCITATLDWQSIDSDPRDISLNFSTYLESDADRTITKIQKISSLAMATRAIGDYESSISIQKQAVALVKKVNGSSIPLFSLSRLALLYIENGDFKRAGEILDQGAEFSFEESVSALALSEYLDITGLLAGANGHWTEALDAHTAALENYMRHDEGESPARAEYINNIGVAGFKLSRYEVADEMFAESLAQRERIYGNKHPILAESKHNQAKLFGARGQLTDAIAWQQDALQTRESMLSTAHPLIADSLNDLGWLLSARGRNEEALSLVRKSCDLIRQSRTEQHPAMGTCFHNLSYHLRILGHYGESLEHLEKALDIRQRVYPSPHPRIANTLDNMGVLYGVLGNPERQIELLEQSLDQRQALFSDVHIDVALSLNNLGYAYAMQNQIERADSAFLQALTIRRQLLPPQHQDIALTMSNLGYIKMLSGSVTRAKELLYGALSIYRDIDSIAPDRVAQVLGILAEIYTLDDRPEEAQTLYLQAIGLLTESEYRNLYAHTLSSFARVLREGPNKDSAIWFQKEAVRMVSGEQSVLPESLQVSYLESNEDLFRTLAGWLIEDNRLEEANQIMDLMDVFQNDQFLRSATPTAREMVYFTPGENAFSRAVSGLLSETRSAMPEKWSFGGSDDADDQHTKSILEKIRQLSSDSFDNSLKKKHTMQVPDECHHTEPTPAKHGTRPDRDSLLVKYVVRSDSIVLLTTTSKGYSSCIVQIDNHTLGKMVSAFRKNIVRNNSRWRTRALQREMYKVLVEPLEGLLRAEQPRRIFFNPDSVLEFLPFAALFDGDQYFGEKYAITKITDGFYPEITKEPNLYLAGFGVAGTHVAAPHALPYVQTELNGIIKENDTDQGVIRGEKYLDDNFTKQHYFDAIKKGIPFLHITGHFVLNHGKLRNSYYLAGNNKILRASTIVQPTFENRALGNVSLIAFPSCETALSYDAIANIGQFRQPLERTFEGETLAAGAIRSGAQSVLASLWKVEDSSTAAFSRRFYDYIGNGFSKTESLKKTRVDFISGEVSCHNFVNDATTRVTSRSTDCSGDWKNPFYWAAFSLYGAP